MELWSDALAVSVAVVVYDAFPCPGWRGPRRVRPWKESSGAWLGVLGLHLWQV